MEKQNEVVIVGGGPVGLWTALQIKNRAPHWPVTIYERHAQYARSHVLRLDHWSMLLYGRHSTDERERAFYRDITGKQVDQPLTRVAGSVYVRTNDLEAALRDLAQSRDVAIMRQLVDSPESVRAAHPGCRFFIAADGAHSRMRSALLGEQALVDRPLQYIIETKCEIPGQVQRSDAFAQLAATRRFRHLGFDYVGKTRDGVTPVTLRLFLSKQEYETLPAATFKAPLPLTDPGIADDIAADIIGYLQQLSRHDACIQNARITKLVLSMYAAREFAVQRADHAWFLVGDAAMGVPYFRALNSGLILASRLAQILAGRMLPVGNDLTQRVLLYRGHRVMHIQSEFAITRGKNTAITAFEMLRSAAGAVGDHESQWLEDYRRSRAFGCDDITDTPSETP